MFTRDEAISMGRSNASMALDAWRDYESIQDAIDCCRDNVRDTLNEHRSAEHEDAAWAAFDAYIDQHRAAAEAAAAREIADIEKAEALAWAEESEQEAWAEAGGYSSGLSRPAGAKGHIADVAQALQVLWAHGYRAWESMASKQCIWVLHPVRVLPADASSKVDHYQRIELHVSQVWDFISYSDDFIEE